MDMDMDKEDCMEDCIIFVKTIQAVRFLFFDYMTRVNVKILTRFAIT